MMQYHILATEESLVNALECLKNSFSNRPPIKFPIYTNVPGLLDRFIKEIKSISSL